MSLTFLNSTAYIASFVLKKGELILFRLPGIAPSASLEVPLNEVYEVTASTIIDGNTFTSAPVSLNGATRFLAQVMQDASQGTYVFNVVQSPSTVAEQLQFEKTCLGPVTFNLLQNGRWLQSVVVANTFEMITLDMGLPYRAFAVINGITTHDVETSIPTAVITAVADNTSSGFGYFSLTTA